MAKVEYLDTPWAQVAPTFARIQSANNGTGGFGGQTSWYRGSVANTGLATTPPASLGVETVSSNVMLVGLS